MEEGPEIKVKYKVDLSELEAGSEKAKKEVGSIVPEIDKANKAGGKFTETLDTVKKGAKELTPELGNASNMTKGLSDMMSKASAIAGGVFVTAALAMAGAISDANAQVSSLDKSVRISSGTQENYATNMASLDGIADKYKTSIFNLAGSFNELARETRGTVNEGQPTADMFETLVSVSKKLSVSVEDTSGSFNGFIERMKQGTVDSTGLSNELDKRLYEAFTNVAQKMSLTNEELNEVLKTSDRAVATTLPQLASELENSLGDIPQKQATDLGVAIEYTTSKLTMLLDGLFQTSGAKSAFVKATEDAGGLLDMLDKVNREHGIMAAGGVALTELGVSTAKALIPGGSMANFEIDHFGYKSSKETNSQKKYLAQNLSYKDGSSVGWNQASKSPYPLPSDIKFDIKSAGEDARAKAEEEANKKRIAEAKRLAAERKREYDQIAKQEIYESNQRIKDQIFALNEAINTAYGKNNGIIGPIAQIQGKGITTGFDNNLKRTQQFTNETTGDGSAVNFDRVTAGIDGVIESTKNKYQQMQAAIKGGMDESLEQINESVTQSLRAAATTAAVGVGEMIGEALATGGEGLEEAGKKFGLMVAGLLKDLGGALIAAATLKIASEKMFSTPGGAVAAVAVGIAAVAAGAYLQTKLNSAEQKFFTGGFVQGPAGVDNVPIWASPGELVVNQGQQSNLLAALNGTKSASDYGAYGGSGFRSGQKESVHVVVEGHLRHDRLDISNRRGARANRYFE